MAMVRDAILDSSAVGDVVLDLFSGSGTTLIAAEVAGRKEAIPAASKSSTATATAPRKQS